MLYSGKFIGEKFCQRLQCAQPVKTLIRLFNHPRLQYGRCLNLISPDGFSLQDRCPAEMGVNFFQKGISHRRINEPQQILSQSAGGAGSWPKNVLLFWKCHGSLDRLHKHFVKTINLLLSQPMTLVIKLIGLNIRIF